jgi:hypothetical protein
MASRGSSANLGTRSLLQTEQQIPTPDITKPRGDSPTVHSFVHEN